VSKDARSWVDHFQIQSEVDLDFVIGQSTGLPVGMQRHSPSEFRRRVLAGAISYSMQLNSIDYALKRYVAPNLYDDEVPLLADTASDHLSGSVKRLMKELRALHTPDPTFGIFGAELTLFKVPRSLDTARMLANRGLLLEVLPILRLCLEMMAWSSAAFYMRDEEQVIALRAQSCISGMKDFYETAGRLYGYLSTFSHWGHVVHGHFLEVKSGQVAVLEASVRYRAMSLALCIVILDVFVEVVRRLYSERSSILIEGVQGVLDRGVDRRTYQVLSSIVQSTGLDELSEIQSFLA
jgi:hypothetical protein